MDIIAVDDAEQVYFDPSDAENISLFDRLYLSWQDFYGMEKVRAELSEEHPDLKLHSMPFYDDMAQVFRSVAKYRAATVRYRNIAYPNAESIVEQLRVEFEHSEAKRDVVKFPVITTVLSDIYTDTLMDVIYSGYLTMSNAVENTIRQIKLVLNIPEEKSNRNDPIIDLELIFSS